MDITVGTWVRVDDSCPISFTIDGDGNSELIMGDRWDGFELICTPVALKRLLAVGADALAKAEGQLAEVSRGQDHQQT